jgi:hypothetical protein
VRGLLKQLQEPIERQPCLFQDMSQRGTLDRAMSRNGNFENLISNVFVEPNVTASLANDNPAISLQRFDDFGVRQTRDFTHTSIS